jgi:thiol:disulfide interchange protein DsbD
MSKMGRVYPRLTLGFVLLSGLIAAVPARAQLGADGFGTTRNRFGGTGSAAVSFSGQFTRPDGTNPARLFIKAAIKPGWEIYSITQPPKGPTRTELKIKPSNQFRFLGGFQTSTPPQKRVDPLYKGLTIETHQRTAIWYAPIQIAAGVDPASLRIEGAVYAQTCELPRSEGLTGLCLPPRDFPFVAALGPGFPVEQASEAPPSPEAPASANPAPPDAAPPEPMPSPSSQQPPGVGPSEGPPPVPGGQQAAGPDRLIWRPFTLASLKRVSPQFDWETMKGNVAGVVDQTPLLPMILLAFIGGLILNVMPCVLPVIGLKVLSFVEQAGHDRRRILVLNLWYSVGIISVFLVLAGLAIGLKLGWGQQFQRPGFNIAMAAIIFALGLSLLGVWEIPIPGFVGRGKAAELAQGEGLTGAFVKGVLTTVLATPCTGPYMGWALAWALRQSAPTTLLVFATVGLGMATPYLLIGAFPNLLRVLPKPGAWMETFKQIMGFVLLATVVYLLTILDPSYVVPTIALLFATWAGCWWIGRQALVLADMGTKVRAWLGASAFVGAVWIFMFPGIGGITGRASLPGLQKLLADRFRQRAELELAEQGLETVPMRSLPSGPSTVLIDFTADWCPNCKLLEATTLSSEKLRELVERNGVVTMTADWTNRSKDNDVGRMLRALGYDPPQIPVVAILPVSDPNHPICFPSSEETSISEAAILDGLTKAGSLQSAPPSAQAASGN